MEGISGKGVKREPPDDQEQNDDVKDDVTTKIQHTNTNMSVKDEDKPDVKRVKLTLDMVTSKEEKAYPCKICFEVFDDEVSLAEHALIHIDTKPQRCDVCGAVFMAEKDLANHMAKHVDSPGNGMKQEPEDESSTHTGDKPYQCVVCQKTFHKEKKLLKHQQKHEELKDDTVRNLVSSLSAYYAQNVATKDDDGEEKPYICQQCQVVFTSEAEYIAHILTCNATASKEHTCAICLQTCATKDMLTTHLLKHNIYGCTVCDEMFTQKRDLAAHVKSHNETEIHGQLSLQETSSGSDESKRKPYECHLCDKSFQRQQNLSQHFRTHDGARSWRCKKCDKTFQMKYSLDRHIISAHRNNTAELQCAKCRKQFKTKSEFNRHLSAHAMENPHECNECGKSFSTNSALLNHARLHANDGDTSLRCSYCSKPFKDKDSLRDHELTHYDERPHQCAVCDEAFVTKYKLQQHQQETGHYEALPEGNIESMATFYCHQCNKVFPVREELLQHIRSKHIYCHLCNRVFPVRKKLLHHIKTKHGTDVDDFFGRSQKSINLFAPSNQDDLERHEITRSARNANGSNKGDYTCFLCDEKFQNLSDLKTHMDNNQCGAKFTCGDCGIKFDTDKSLFCHMAQHEQKLDRADAEKVTDPSVTDPSLIKDEVGGTFGHPRETEVSHQCPVCNKLFKDRMDLKEHCAIHAMGQPEESQQSFQRPVCNRTFNHKGNFKEHCSTHTDDKPYQCDLCGKSFRTKWKLERHYGTHEGEKPYKCKKCVLSFALKYQLEEHERTRHGQKSTSKTGHKCSLCGKTFTLSGGLKTHMDTFHMKKPFQCDLCPASFSSELRLSFHMDSHENEPAPLDTTD